MRTLLLILALVAAPAASALPNGAAQLFAERTALLAADSKCHVLGAPVRAALTATTTQARFAALRDGWSSDALAGVSQRASAAGRARACNDAAVLSAAKGASGGYLGWSRMPSMLFPGASAAWAARRAPDMDGWTLTQNLADGARFGLATGPTGAEMLVLSLPAKPGAAPSTATLFLRDAARAPRPLLDVPGVTPLPGLAGGLAPRSVETARLASQRVAYQPEKAPPRTLFLFPVSVLNDIAALDPRETIEIEITGAAGTSRVLIEIGDLAAARAFLAAKSV